MEQSAFAYEIVAVMRGNDPKPARIINRLIRPEPISMGVSETHKEWTWDFDTEAGAEEMMTILNRVSGLEVTLHRHPIVVPEAMAA